MNNKILAPRVKKTKSHKPNFTNLALFYGLTRQTVSKYKKKKQRLYLAMVEHYKKDSNGL